MRFEHRRKIQFGLIVLFLLMGLTQIQFAPAQEPEPKAKSKMNFMQMPLDPRVQTRSYLFEDTNEEIEYNLFISSKVTKDKESPLIVTLHGLGAPPRIMFMGPTLDLAEEGGYILVGPMGYNVRGWYGLPMPDFSKMKPKTKSPAKEDQSDAKTMPKTMPEGKANPFFNQNDPPNIRELSEKDVMNVLDIIRKEFNVDERRIYLTGHSMGGAGTLHLGIKYPSIWAALAPVAPAAFGLNPDGLEKIKDMPVLFIHGDKDEAVPVDVSRRWVEKAKELNMTYDYNEMPGVTHGPVITESLPSIYEFFGKHSKPVVH